MITLQRKWDPIDKWYFPQQSYVTLSDIPSKNYAGSTAIKSIFWNSQPNYQAVDLECWYYVWCEELKMNKS